MSLNYSEKATPSTRLRLTYRISAGQYVGAETARAAAQRLNERLEALPLPAYVASPATEPQQGGATGAGIFGLLAAAVGEYDYFTTVDMVTVATPIPGSPTWGQMLDPARSVPPSGWASLDTSIELDSADMISRTSPVAVAPAAQQGATTNAARSSQQNSAPATLASATSNITIALVVIAVVALAVYVWLKRRR